METANFEAVAWNVIGMFTIDKYCHLNTYIGKKIFASKKSSLSGTVVLNITQLFDMSI